MFQNENKRSRVESIARAVYPKGGWKRAAIYMWHRVRRIQDSPGNIARGAFAGTFVSFTPLFGVHFFLGPLFAYCIGGNILASILFVLVCNPITFPVIAVSSIWVGRLVLGETVNPTVAGANDVQVATQAVDGVLANFQALVFGGQADWSSVLTAAADLFLPYMIGGTLLGLLSGAFAAWAVHAVTAVYQRHRKRKFRSDRQ